MPAISLQSKNARVLRLVRQADRDDVVAALGAETVAERFTGKPGEIVMLPEGDVAALFGIGDGKSEFALGAAALSLPEGEWRLENLPGWWDPELAAIAWCLGAYKFTTYKPADRGSACLVLPPEADAETVCAIADASELTRNLVNTPAQDMGPVGLEKAFRDLASQFDATVRVTEGNALLEQNFPMIYAVGRAASEAPRLLELEWGHPDHPRVSVIGKGVCFDSGGLDLKAAKFMRLMKKDMGGGANAMGLAHMIMATDLPVRLHLLVPAVENAVSAGAFRPGDVISSRKGLKVEIDNTDAEGRLVLGDALTRACEDKPDLVLDFATLTGAARVALGPEVMPFYTDDDDLAAALSGAGETVDDPLWRMPLWDGYDSYLEGEISDLVNSDGSGFAGSITAALFLRNFVDTTNWVHFDIFAWNPKPRPGRPKGGEIQATRAVYQMLKDRFVD